MAKAQKTKKSADKPEARQPEGHGARSIGAGADGSKGCLHGESL